LQNTIDGLYRIFLKSLNDLTNLLKKDETMSGMKHIDKAFKELGDLLCSESLLQYLHFTKSFTVTMDASGYAIGGMEGVKEL